MDSMDYREFEKIVLSRLDKEAERGKLTASRYGTMSSHMKNPATGQLEIVTHQSLPDFEGILFGTARQFILDCKLCNQASFNLSPYLPGMPGENRSKIRQLKHLLERRRFGAICFLLLHFPVRDLKTKTDPQMTVAFPVDETLPFWQRALTGEQRSITRTDCQEIGVMVPWNTYERERLARPDVLKAILTLGGYTHGEEETEG